MGGVFRFDWDKCFNRSSIWVSKLRLDRWMGTPELRIDEVRRALPDEEGINGDLLT